MLENIVRHRELGESKKQAALKGAKEITFAAMAAFVAEAIAAVHVTAWRESYADLMPKSVLGFQQLSPGLEIRILFCTVLRILGVSYESIRRLSGIPNEKIIERAVQVVMDGGSTWIWGQSA